MVMEESNNSKKKVVLYRRPPDLKLARRIPIMHHLMPKSICSPSRSLIISSPSKRTRSHRAPLFRSRLTTATKTTAPEPSEPTSPTVNCAGQIRNSANSKPCRNWQSVIEEIEKIHDHSKKKRVAPAGKKSVLGFLALLKGLRLDFRCFGAPPDVSTSSDEDDEEEKKVDEQRAFEKWVMVLEEKKDDHTAVVVIDQKNTIEEEKKVDEEEESTAPPKNALVLMRCRSAPSAVRLLKVNETESNCKGEENLVLMSYNSCELLNISEDIARETWVRKSDFLQRSCSLRR